MPTFCRHGRMLQNCVICTRRETPARQAPRSRRTPSAAAPARSRTSGPRLEVRRVQREVDDGFEHELVPGLRSTADAARLADELAFSEARLAELRDDPPGLYADVASSGDAEEACWLAFLIAYLGPSSAPSSFEAFAGITAARVSWASGELPRLDGVPLGPRSAHAPERGAAAVVAYRAWAARAGSQRAGLLGAGHWEPERRFARTFERLALPGLDRGVRFELLVSLGALGVVPLTAGALALGAAGTDRVVQAAKRVLGIGDAVNLERRAAALAHGVDAPFAALDLALFNWSAAAGGRATMGAATGPAPARRDEIRALLGLDDVS